MARSFPADTKMQHFFEEQFNKETGARLQFYVDEKEGRTRKLSASRSTVVGLPQINPMEFALRKKREEEEALRQIIADARQQQRTTEEMRAVDDKTKETLYEGFSREGRGRYRYLRDRNRLSPEAKFTFPILSSWEYGWKVGDEMSTYGRPRNARTAMIQDSFYTRNGVPTLSSPDSPTTIYRSYTFG